MLLFFRTSLMVFLLSLSLASANPLIGRINDRHALNNTIEKDIQEACASSYQQHFQKLLHRGLDTHSATDLAQYYSERDVRDAILSLIRENNRTTLLNVKVAEASTAYREAIITWLSAHLHVKKGRIIAQTAKLCVP